MWEKQAMEVVGCAETFMFCMYATAANNIYTSE